MNKDVGVGDREVVTIASITSTTSSSTRTTGIVRGRDRGRLPVGERGIRRGRRRTGATAIVATGNSTGGGGGRRLAFSGSFGGGFGFDNLGSSNKGLATIRRGQCTLLQYGKTEVVIP